MSFGKITGFKALVFLFMYKLSFLSVQQFRIKIAKNLSINSNENKNVIISKWVEVNWVSFRKTLFNFTFHTLWPNYIGMKGDIQDVELGYTYTPEDVSYKWVFCDVHVIHERTVNVCCTGWGPYAGGYVNHPSIHVLTCTENSFLTKG